MRAQVTGFAPERQLAAHEAMQLYASHRQEIDDELFEDLAVDWCVQHEDPRPKKLLISDMDSTIIGQECLDELAAVAGQGDQVRAITERAMAGELDFAASLTERVATLKDQPSGILETVWRDVIRPNPGAAILAATMKAHGAKTALVSGGFTFFVKRVAAQCGFEHFFANELHVKDGLLTGTVWRPILDAQAKRTHLLELVADPVDALAMGDGANDLAMVQAAGLGVAFKPKPVLAQAANGVIRHTELSTALYFQGIAKADWVTSSVSNAGSRPAG